MKKLKKKLQLNKLTIANLNNQSLQQIKGGIDTFNCDPITVATLDCPATLNCPGQTCFFCEPTPNR